VSDSLGSVLSPEQVVPIHADALKRWGAAGDRLGLDERAVAAGTVLLVGELGTESEPARAVRRAEIVDLLAPAYGRDGALQGLLALEARGVAQVARWESGAWLAQQVELAPRVREVCLGVNQRPQSPPSQGHAVSRIRALVDRCLTKAEGYPERYLIVLRGRSGSGRDGALAYFLERLGQVARERSVFELRSESDRLEPEVSGAAPVWDARGADPGPDDYAIARRWLGRSATIAFALVDSHHDAPDVAGRIALKVELDPADADERQVIWLYALRELPLLDARRRDIAAAMSRRSGAGAGLAARAVASVGDLELEDTAALMHELEAALEEQVQPSSTKGVIVERPEVTLDRVVSNLATASALERLRSLCETHTQVMGSHRGVAALFSGASGTGKTLAGRALAASLRRPLFRVDLAGVVSKWVGETEKNLRTALAAAEAAGAVLLFDEGDALFGKRGEVAKGSDRYANLEVSYLLQALEAYEGIAIVTTNLRSNVDHAFARRFDAIIEFSTPDHTQRLQIWRQELGASVATDMKGELERLARSADLSGGNIASAARIARAIALARGAALVSPADLHTAVESEFMKLGSAVQASGWRRSAVNGRPTA